MQTLLKADSNGQTVTKLVMFVMYEDLAKKIQAVLCPVVCRIHSRLWQHFYNYPNYPDYCHNSKD